MASSTTGEITPRRGPTRTVRAIIGAIVAFLFVPLGVVATTSAPAFAVDENCIGKVTPRQSEMMWHIFKYPEKWGGSDKQIKASGRALYWDCPNGAESRKVRIKAFSWCWTFVAGEEHNFFVAAHFNPVISNVNGNVSNPPSFKIWDVWAKQDCATQDIPYDDERWIYVKNSPGWQATSRIEYIDSEFTGWTELFNIHGGDLDLLEPAEDTATGPAYEP